jgi:LuxR family transcriptional regulator, maltose regulon positive regulatory protein
MRARALLGQVQRAEGRLDAALRTYRQVLEITAPPGQPALPGAGVAYVGMAEVAYQRGEFDTALRQVSEGIALCRQFADAVRGAPLPLATGLATLAWIRQAQGDSGGALAAMEEAERVAPGPGVTSLLNPVSAQRAQLLLAQGDVAGAVGWAEQRGLGANDEPTYPREPEYLVLVRVLLAQQALEPALELLERLHAQAAAQGRTGSVIEIRALQALARSAGGDQAGALAALAEALALAAPQGYLRVFVDEGPPMTALLREVVGRRQERSAAADAVPRDYLVRLVEAFEQANLPVRPPLRRGGVMVAELVEPLTERELEVLRLLATGAPNRAIAKQLVVSLDTVKRHLSHLFSKLEVANRTQAVGRARELGLLP